MADTFDEVIFRPNLARWLGAYLAMAELCGSMERVVSHCLLRWADVVSETFGKTAKDAYDVVRKETSKWKD